LKEGRKEEDLLSIRIEFQIEGAESTFATLGSTSGNGKEMIAGGRLEC